MNSRKNNVGGETSLGGLQGSFPRTTWGLLSQSREATGRERAGLEDLCRRYWKPVYRYIRMSWAKTNDDAKDLTQAFFLWFLEGDALKRYQPERGSFRRYLKVLLGGFVVDQDKALKRLKRGGGVKIIPVDDGDLSLDEALPDAKATDPGKAFDRAWGLEVARNAIDRVRQRYLASDRGSQFQAFELYDLDPPSPSITYAEVGTKVGLTEQEVRHALADVRSAVHDELQAELSVLMTDPGDLEEEWNALFGS